MTAAHDNRAEQVTPTGSGRTLTGSRTGPSELDGAVNAAFQTMFGRDLNGTVEEKAVALLYGVAKAHTFFDGNKRTAWYAFTTFLNLNGLRFTEQIGGYQDDQVRLGREVDR